MNTLFSKPAYDTEALRDDIQRLLRATADIADDAVVDARKRLKASYGKAGEAWEHGAKYALSYLKGHVWETAAVAAITGLATGLLLTHRHD